MIHRLSFCFTRFKQDHSPILRILLIFRLKPANNDKLSSLLLRLRAQFQEFNYKTVYLVPQRSLDYSFLSMIIVNYRNAHNFRVLLAK